MITGTTSQGVNFEFDERLVSDWDMVEAIAMSESEDNGVKLQGLTNYCKIVLGERKLRKMVKDLKKKNNGIAPVEEIYTVVKEIMDIVKEKNDEVKNSTSSPQ